MKVSANITGFFVGEKGFTLFTALVAVMIVFLGVLVTQSMIAGERSSVQIISGVQEEAQMLDFASFSKNDAIQQFNWGLRTSFEKYFTRDGGQGTPADGIPDNQFYIKNSFFAPTDNTLQLKFDAIRKEFVKQNFGDLANCRMTNPLTEDIPDSCSITNFVEFTAAEIKKALQVTKTEHEYESKIEQDYDDYTFKKILLYVFSRSAAHDEFLDVSNCDGTWADCKGGGFYINLDFSAPPPANPTTGVSNEVYEALPKIVVKKTDTCDEFGVCGKVLKQPIFPRGVLRVFVPTRIFKALAGANEIINSQDMFNKNSPFKQGFKKIKLGVCDTNIEWHLESIPTLQNPHPPCKYVCLNSCYPRTDFEKPQTIYGYSQACVGTTNIPAGYMLTSVPLNSGGKNYNPYNPYPPELTALITGKADISMKGSLDEYAENVLQGFVEHDAKANSIFSESNTGEFKLLKTNGKFVWDPVVVESFGAVSRNVMPSGSYAQCEKVSKVRGLFVFEDENPLYRIDLSHDTRFAIGVSDSDYNPPGSDNPVFGFDDPAEKLTTCTTLEKRTPIGNTGRFEISYSCPDPNLGKLRGLGPECSPQTNVVMNC